MASRRSRGQHGAGTPSEQNHTSNDGASGSDALEHDEPDNVGQDQHDSKEATAARRMRKRETDRVAQREHRRRQREHTQNLEARLSLLTKQPEAAEINKLIQENEELKREVWLLLLYLLNDIPGLTLGPYNRSRPGGNSAAACKRSSAANFGNTECLRLQVTSKSEKASSHPHPLLERTRITRLLPGQKRHPATS